MPGIVHVAPLLDDEGEGCFVLGVCGLESWDAGEGEGCDVAWVGFCSIALVNKSLYDIFYRLYISGCSIHQVLR